MRLSGSRTYYRSKPPKMPSGLVELIEDLTREVLKNNPTDIYGFCAGHVQQLLEIRDGPKQKKTLTLEEKIARAQEKVRQRAQQRRQQYNNDLLKQQSCTKPKINVTSNTEDETPPITLQELTPDNILKTPTLSDQELGNLSEVELSHESPTTSEDSQYQNDVLKDEPTITACEAKSNKNLPESTNETTNCQIIEDPSLNKLPKNESHDTTVHIMLDNEPKEDEEKTNGGKEPLIENLEVVPELDMTSQKQHLSSPINSVIIVNQVCNLFDSDKKNIGDSVQADPINAADNELGERNLIKPTVNVLANGIVEAETQNDKVNLSCNDKEESQLLNNTEIIQQLPDSNTTHQLNSIDNVELTTNSHNVANENEEDSQTNTIDISFKESPTVELQDSIINSDMLEALLETHTDSDIMTLITQESTNDELNQHNAFKLNSVNATDSITNPELSQISKENKDSNVTILTREEIQENTELQNQGYAINLKENATKDNDTDNNHDTLKISDAPQVHNQDSNMDLETAAVTIQKVFRTFLFKNRASTFEDSVNDDTLFLNEGDQNKEECDYPISGSLNERRPHGITRMDTVLQTVNEEKSLSLSTDDSSTLSSAATIIQAHVRGFLVRNKLNSNKTISTNSIAASNSNQTSLTSLEIDNEQNKNKTVLNIHIVPEGGNYISRDESLITSMDLSLDSSPPSSINLHPLGYDKSERRKQLKREDAIQSISPPSNNSGKLSEDIDSVKELPLNGNEMTGDHKADYSNLVNDDLHEGTCVENVHVENMSSETISPENPKPIMEQKEASATKLNSDEMDVVTPFISKEEDTSDKKLMHSGEFHDAVLPTKVLRSDTSVASEFKNVLVYFLLWNHS